MLRAFGFVLLLISHAALLAQPLAELDVVQVSGETGQALDERLRRFESKGFSGSVLVVRDDRVILLKGYGFANIGQNIPNTPSTRFEMNSMTKMFTAASVLRLAGSGRLKLDDRVELHLGPFPAAKSKATITHLATHTAGLVLKGTELAGTDRDVFVESAKRAPIESEPGVVYRYTNAGYSLLAAIIERASGVSYEDYLRQNIFGPAGMGSAVFRDEVPKADPRFARGYVGGATGPVSGPPNPYSWGTVGAGGVWCTVGDVYRWVLFLESGKAFSAEYRELLFSEPRQPSKESFGWAFQAKSSSGRMSITKGGGSDDFASQLLYFPEDRVVIVWSTNNLSKRWRQELNSAITNILFGRSAPVGLPR
ncbi:MAG: beta-lactamase family protein [Bryobacteraceae bacterium]|nr:beta-lactamase family protein [Bryobacteraceae bacterium]